MKATKTKPKAKDKAKPMEKPKAKPKTAAKAVGPNAEGGFPSIDDDVPDDLPITDDPAEAIPIDEDDLHRDRDLGEDEDDDDLDLDDDDLEEDLDDDELDEDLEEDDFDILLGKALASPNGEPFVIRVRRLQGNLQPIVATASLADWVAAGKSMRELVSQKTKGKPGRYLIQLFDPMRKQSHRSHRYVTIEAPAPPSDVAEIERSTEVLRARKRQTEAMLELESLSSQRSGANQQLVSLFERLEKRLQRLERGPRSEPSAFEKYLPIAAPFLAKAAERLFASPAETFTQLAPLMTAQMESAAKLQLEKARGDNARADMILEQLLRQHAAQTGTPTPEPEEENSLVGLLRQALGAFRPAAPSSAAPGAVPSERVAPQPMSRFAKFVEQACRAVGKLQPADAARKIQPVWLKVPDEERFAFLTGDDQDHLALLQALPPGLRSHVVTMAQDARANAWMETFRAELLAIDPLTAGDTEDAEIETDDTTTAPSKSSASPAPTVSQEDLVSGAA